MRVLLRAGPLLSGNARASEDLPGRLGIHARLYQSEADRSAAVLVPRGQRVHGVDRSVSASEGDGMGGGFSQIYRQEPDVFHRRIRARPEDPSTRVPVSGAYQF